MNNEAGNSGETDAERENSIYPNPATENAIFSYNLSEGENGFLEIFSLPGTKVAAYRLSSHQQELQLSVNDLENGVYMYRFSINGEPIEAGKLVIINDK